MASRRRRTSQRLAPQIDAQRPTDRARQMPGLSQMMTGGQMAGRIVPGSGGQLPARPTKSPPIRQAPPGGYGIQEPIIPPPGRQPPPGGYGIQEPVLPMPGPRTDPGQPVQQTYGGQGAGNSYEALLDEYNRRLAQGNSGNAFLEQHDKFAQNLANNMQPGPYGGPTRPTIPAHTPQVPPMGAGDTPGRPRPPDWPPYIQEPVIPPPQAYAPRPPNVQPMPLPQVPQNPQAPGMPPVYSQPPPGSQMGPNGIILPPGWAQVGDMYVQGWNQMTPEQRSALAAQANPNMNQAGQQGFYEQAGWQGPVQPQPQFLPQGTNPMQPEGSPFYDQPNQAQPAPQQMNVNQVDNRYPGGGQDFRQAPAQGATAVAERAELAAAGVDPRGRGRSDAPAPAELGLPLSPEFEAGRRALEDELSGTLASIATSREELMSMVELVKARLATDLADEKRMIDEQMNARGIFDSGVRTRDTNRAQFQSDRTLVDVGLDAAGKLNQLAASESGARSSYLKGLAELLMNAARNSATDENAPTPRPEDEEPDKPKKPKKKKRKKRGGRGGKA